MCEKMVKKPAHRRADCLAEGSKGHMIIDTDSLS